MQKTFTHWLDYFELLKTYEQKGLLEIQTDYHEAYITRAALYALANADECKSTRRQKVIFETARHFHTYAAWKSQQGSGYFNQPFAVNVVHEDMPHDLLYTIFISFRRRLWWPFRKTACFNIIHY